MFFFFPLLCLVPYFPNHPHPLLLLLLSLFSASSFPPGLPSLCFLLSLSSAPQPLLGRMCQWVRWVMEATLLISSVCALPWLGGLQKSALALRRSSYSPQPSLHISIRLPQVLMAWCIWAEIKVKEETLYLFRFTVKHWHVDQATDSTMWLK